MSPSPAASRAPSTRTTRSPRPPDKRPPNHVLGELGERLAVRFLQRAGYAILDRNWRCREGELDIVACDGETVVFCEVKTRTSATYGTPASAVDQGKSHRLRSAALRWLAQAGLGHVPVRFDVLGVRPRSETKADVEHLMGAF